MKVFFYIIGSLSVFFVAYWSYSINYETRKNIDKAEKLKLQIKDNMEHYEILKAEWAYLNRPERLEKLVEKYFNYLRLMPISSLNYSDISYLEFNEKSKLNQNVELDK